MNDNAQTSAEPESIVGALQRGWKVASAIAGIAALIGGVIGAGGYRVVGPPQDVVALRQEIHRVDTTATHRIDQLQSHLDSLRADVQDVRTELRFNSYVQCVQIRMSAPALRPPGCDAPEIEQAGRTRGARR